MDNTTDPARAAVEAHLDIVRRHNEDFTSEFVIFARLATRYGWSVSEIASRIGVDPQRVELALSSPEGVV